VRVHHLLTHLVELLVSGWMLGLCSLLVLHMHLLFDMSELLIIHLVSLMALIIVALMLIRLGMRVALIFALNLTFACLLV
jgi:hypothetical protein